MRPKPKLWRIAIATVGVIVLGGVMAWTTWMRMPGKSHEGALDPLDERGRGLRESLERDVVALAREIGERNVAHPEALARAADLVQRRLTHADRPPSAQGYRVGEVLCKNFELELPGGRRPDQIVVIGAHYDSAPGTPGADDNATGTAALFALAERFAGRTPERTLRFVAFVNEEPPHFQTDAMGSWVYAKRSRERGERVTAMLSLESLGYFSDQDGSQKYPPPLGFFYPSRGDFIGFVGNPRSRDLVRSTLGVFRDQARFPAEGAALPGVLPGIGWSDHWAFWQAGYPAVMVTDTAPFRNPHYHLASDTPERVDYERLARVVMGLEHVIRDLAGG